jgi:acylphosphatase
MGTDRSNQPMMEAVMADKRIRALVYGRVQGVNFRWYTRQRANQLELRGWVRNLLNGRRVEVVAEGPEDKLRELVRFLYDGPPAADVDNVDIEWKEATDEFNRFSIRY